MSSLAHQRLRYLDFARSVLFVLGIVLHAAWLLRQQSAVLQLLHDAIHSFRMPAFFVIGGFFCAHMLDRYSPAEFLTRRLRRLGLPLVSFVVVDTLIDCANRTGWTDYSPELNKAYWVSGEWFEHLWFLGTLLAYVFGLFLAHQVFQSMDRRISRIKAGRGLFLAGTAVIWFGAVHLERIFPAGGLHQAWFFIDQIKLFEYVAFFIAGYFLFHHRKLLDEISSLIGWNAAGVLLYGMARLPLEQSAVGHYMRELWSPIYCLNVCGVLFWVGKRFFDQSDVIQRLSGASYTIYLVHWPMLVLLNRVFVRDGLPVSALFLLFVVLTSILSYATHIYVVEKSPVLALLLNGRPLSESPTASADVSDVMDEKRAPLAWR